MTKKGKGYSLLSSLVSYLINTPLLFSGPFEFFLIRKKPALVCDISKMSWKECIARTFNYDFEVVVKSNEKGGYTRIDSQKSKINL